MKNRSIIKRTTENDDDDDKSELNEEFNGNRENFHKERLALLKPLVALQKKESTEEKIEPVRAHPSCPLDSPACRQEPYVHGEENLHLEKEQHFFGVIEFLLKLYVQSGTSKHAQQDYCEKMKELLDILSPTSIEVVEPQRNLADSDDDFDLHLQQLDCAKAGKNSGDSIRTSEALKRKLGKERISLGEAIKFISSSFLSEPTSSITKLGEAFLWTVKNVNRSQLTGASYRPKIIVSEAFPIDDNHKQYIKVQAMFRDQVTERFIRFGVVADEKFDGEFDGEIILNLIDQNTDDISSASNIKGKISVSGKKIDQFFVTVDQSKFYDSPRYLKDETFQILCRIQPRMYGRRSQKTAGLMKALLEQD